MKDMTSAEVRTLADQVARFIEFTASKTVKGQYDDYAWWSTATTAHDIRSFAKAMEAEERQHRTLRYWREQEAA